MPYCWPGAQNYVTRLNVALPVQCTAKPNPECRGLQWRKESHFVHRVPARRMGSCRLKPKLSSGFNHEFLRAEFEGWVWGTGWCALALGVRVLTGDSWNLAVYGKIRDGASALDLTAPWALRFSWVLVFRFWSCFSPLALCRG